MKNKYISIAILIMVVAQFFSCAAANAAVDELPQQSQDLTLENPLQRLERITAEKEQQPGVTPRFAGALTIAAFLAANPALTAGVLFLGLAALAVGVRFGSLQEAYEFGLRVREQMTDAAYNAAVKGATIVMTASLKKALVSAKHGQTATFPDSSTALKSLSNARIDKDGWTNYYFAFNLPAGVKEIYLDPRLTEDYKLSGERLTVKSMLIDVWKESSVFPSRVIDNLSPTVRNDSGYDRKIKRISSSNKRIRYEYKGVTYGEKVTSIDIHSADSYMKPSIPITKYDLMSLNITVTFPNDLALTGLGDVADNPRGAADELTNINSLYPTAPNLEINPEYPVFGNVGAIDIPGIFGKEDGYSEDDRQVIGDIVSSGEQAGTGEIAQPGGSGEDDEDDTGGNSLTWLLRIWNFLKAMLNPMNTNIATIIKDISGLYTYIGNKFTEQNIMIAEKTGAVMKKLGEIGDAISGKDSEVDFSKVISAVNAIPGQVSDSIKGLWQDAGAVWDGLSDRVSELGSSMAKNFENVMDGIDAGVKDFSGKLAGVKDSIEAKVGSMADSIAKSLEDVKAGADSLADSISKALTKILEWLKDFFVPDFAGIQASWQKTLDRLKLKFKPALDVVTAFPGVFAARKSVYDIELDIFDQKVRPVPMNLKPAIDNFRIFTSALCVLLTVWRAYKRVVGEDEAIAT